VNPYGTTKMTCELMLRDCAAATTLTFMALRYFNAAGADPEGDIGECHVPETHAIPLLLDAAAGEGSFTVFGDDYPTADGTCIRDYVHVTDLADAHVRALQDLLRGGGSASVNVGTGRGWSVRELIDIARKVTGRDIPIRFGARRPGDPPELVSDPALAHTRLGWSARYADVSDHVAHAWAWRQGRRRTFKRAQALAVQ
jgi:UDP-glucose 4-epimerase